MPSPVRAPQAPNWSEFEPNRKGPGAAPIRTKTAPGRVSAAPATAQQAAIRTGDSTKPLSWPVFLLAQTKELISVYAEACAFASEKGVPPAVVRTLLLSSFINVSKGGHV